MVFFFCREGAGTFQLRGGERGGGGGGVKLGQHLSLPWIGC